MALFVGPDVSLKMTSICVVESDGSLVWEGKAESDPTPLTKALSKWRKKIKLIGIEACPLSEWLYGALVESGLETVCIETRHAQRFLSSRPNKTDRSDARGIAEMMRLGHFRPVHVKSRESQLLRLTMIARRKFVDHMLAMEDTIRGLFKVHGPKVGAVHRCTFAARVETRTSGRHRSSSRRRGLQRHLIGIGEDRPQRSSRWVVGRSDLGGLQFFELLTQPAYFMLKEIDSFPKLHEKP